MRRLRPLDRILLPLLLSVWALAFAFHLNEVVRGRLAWVGVFVSNPKAEEYPVVRAFWPGTAAASSGLTVGDHLLGVGPVSLRGVGPVGFTARVYEQAGPELRVPISYQRGATSGETTLTLTPAVYPWRIAPLVATMAITGVLVLLRVPEAPIARPFFLAAIAYATHWTFFPGGMQVQTYAWAVLFALSSAVQFPLWLRAAMIFPAETAPARLPWWPWVFAAFGPAAFTWVFGTPLPPNTGQSAALAVNIAFMVTILAVAAHNLRRAGAVGRRQFKWVAYGLYVGVVPLLAANVVTWMRPSLLWLNDMAALTLVAVPVGFLIAIVRFNLFDIDRLIATTVLYSLLSFFFTAALLTIVPWGAEWLSTTSRLDRNLTQALLAAGVAGGMVPGQRMLRPHVERLFFRQRLALRDGVELLLNDFRGVAVVDRLLELVHERLAALLEPERCILYRRVGTTYQPFEHPGDREPVRAAPAIEETLVAFLRLASGPVDLQGHEATLRTATLPDSTRLLFEALGIVLLLPIRRGDQLAGFLALGRMRAGDIYTATDLALLGAVASAVGTELVRIDVGRYAPRRIVEGFERDPQMLTPAEREVTILFADMRGSMALAETIDQATFCDVQEQCFAAMGVVIERQQGILVRIIGDAVMALWNTPVVLADHAARACTAALEMMNALDRVNRDWASRGVPPITVRIGIHTGPATVGNFGTAQRLEYDARGDAVNLASRLEGLGKLYRASLLISDTTRSRLGTGFACREIDLVRVVGRTRPVVVHEVLRTELGERMQESWNAALAMYRERRWDEAVERFITIVQEHPDDGPASVYLERCRRLRATPPSAEWDGVFEAQVK